MHSSLFLDVGLARPPCVGPRPEHVGLAVHLHTHPVEGSGPTLHSCLVLSGQAPSAWPASSHVLKPPGRAGVPQPASVPMIRGLLGPG